MVNRSNILEKIRRAGVVGAGGAGFPTYKKLDAKVDCIIANGAECEPLLQKDRESMLRDTTELFRGLKLMQEVTGASRIVIALKRKNEDVAEKLAEEAKREGVELFVYADVYPAGDEFVLVYEITGRRIPPGGLPLHVGCVVDNVETIANLARAVDGIPVTDKYVTVCGAVQNPLTTCVPVGTSMIDCVKLAGGATVDNPVALTGGLMMGGSTTDLSIPVTKTIGGVIVLPEDHYLFRRKTQAKETYTRIGHGQCDQCSLCTELCPRYIMGYPIQPHMVMRSLQMTGSDKDRGSLWAQYCCECNVCSLIACPEMLDPARICVDAKALLREKKVGRTEQELETLFVPPHPARKGREVPIQTLYRRLGLTPYDRKADFVETDLQPQQVAIPLNAHIGRPADSVVKVGDIVQRGRVIGEVPDDALGCPVHASINGRVSSVTAEHIQICAGS
jgi:Na+-translocating ferredoxin:NAD+ oxidoreductase RnfC subunit